MSEDEEEETPLAPATPTVVRPTPRSFRRPQKTEQDIERIKKWLNEDSDSAPSTPAAATPTSTAVVEEKKDEDKGGDSASKVPHNLKVLGLELVLAAEKGELSELESLIERKAVLTTKVQRPIRYVLRDEKEGWRWSESHNVDYTALHAAAQGGHVACLGALLDAGADVDISLEPSKLTALHVACIYGREACVARLISAKADLEIEGQHKVFAGVWTTPLHIATGCCRTQTVEALLTAKAQVDHADENGKTALMIAQLLPQKRKEAATQLTQALVAHGASVNRTDDERDMIPLHLAAGGGHADSLKLLLGQGANVNLPAFNTRESALHCACRAGFATCVELLVGAGAQLDYQRPSERHCEGYAPLHLCVGEMSEHVTGSVDTRLECAKLLLKAKAHLDAPLTKPLENYESWGYRAGLGKTPLLHACVQGNAPAVRMLLRAKADLQRTYGTHADFGYTRGSLPKEAPCTILDAALHVGEMECADVLRRAGAKSLAEEAAALAAAELLEEEEQEAKKKEGKKSKKKKKGANAGAQEEEAAEETKAAEHEAADKGAATSAAAPPAAAAAAAAAAAGSPAASASGKSSRASTPPPPAVGAVAIGDDDDDSDSAAAAAATAAAAGPAAAAEGADPSSAAAAAAAGGESNGSSKGKRNSKSKQQQQQAHQAAEAAAKAEEAAAAKAKADAEAARLAAEKAERKERQEHATIMRALSACTKAQTVGELEAAIAAAAPLEGKLPALAEEVSRARDRLKQLLERQAKDKKVQKEAKEAAAAPSSSSSSSSSQQQQQQQQQQQSKPPKQAPPQSQPPTSSAAEELPDIVSSVAAMALQSDGTITLEGGGDSATDDEDGGPPMPLSAARLLSASALGLVRSVQPTAEFVQAQAELLHELQHILAGGPILPGFHGRLVTLGACCSGLLHEGGTLDLTLLCDDLHAPHPRMFPPQLRAELTSRLARMLLTCKKQQQGRHAAAQWVASVEEYAGDGSLRPPMVRLTAKWSGTTPGRRMPMLLHVHITVDDWLGVWGSLLVRNYAAWDSRARELCLFVKEWARRRGLLRPPTAGGGGGGGHGGALSSHAWVLLCIFHLQNCRPAKLVPALQQLPCARRAIAREQLGQGGGGHGGHGGGGGSGGGGGAPIDCSFASLEDPAAVRMRAFRLPESEDITLGELIRGFFTRYEREFRLALDATQHTLPGCAWLRRVVSVRTGRVLVKPPPRDDPEAGRRFLPFGIEDPFELERDLTATLPPSALEEVHAELRDARDLITPPADQARRLGAFPGAAGPDEKDWPTVVQWICAPLQ